jgi:hypothetical protein
MMRRTVLILVATTLLGGQGAMAAAQQQPPVAEVTGGDDLVKQKGYFRETWVHPDADITRYNKLYFWQAMFQFREGGETRGGGTSLSALRSEGPYAVAPEARDKFKKIVLDALVEELQRSKQFEVVDTVGPETLILRAGVLDITSDVPPAARHVDAYLSSVGEGTFVVQMIDAKSGVIQATVGERRKIQPPAGAVGKRATTASVWGDVEQWAHAVAADFRRELDKAKKKAEKK